MKAFFVVSLVITLAACGPSPHTSPEDMISYDRSTTCFNGVQYYTGNNIMTPKFNPDSTVATCGEGTVE